MYQCTYVSMYLSICPSACLSIYLLKWDFGRGLVQELESRCSRETGLSGLRWADAGVGLGFGGLGV